MDVIHIKFFVGFFPETRVSEVSVFCLFHPLSNILRSIQKSLIIFEIKKGSKKWTIRMLSDSIIYVRFSFPYMTTIGYRTTL